MLSTWNILHHKELVQRSNYINSIRLLKAKLLDEDEKKALGLEADPFCIENLEAWLNDKRDPLDQMASSRFGDRFKELEVDWSRVTLGGTLGAGGAENE